MVSYQYGEKGVNQYVVLILVVVDNGLVLLMHLSYAVLKG